MRSLARPAVRAVLALTALARCLVGSPSPAASGPPGDGADTVARHRETIERSAEEPFEQDQRQAALRALGRIGGPEAAEVACSVLEDPFAHLRDHAQHLLERRLRARLEI